MNYKFAQKLHNENIVIDCHLDLASEIFNRVNMGEDKIIKKYYLNHLKNSGIKIVISSVFIEDIFLPEMALKMALNQINFLKADIKQTSEEVILIKTKKDLDIVLNSDKIGFLISLEGLEPILNDINLIDTFYDLGVRGAGLTWSRRNFVGDGCFFSKKDQGKKGGLTNFGVEVVKKMESLNMFIDISHLNDEGVEDVIVFTTKPFIASHSNSRKINNIMRNLSDKHILAVADSGGTIGINSIMPIIDIQENDNYIKKMCDHIDHISSLVGCGHISFGFDICIGMDKSSIRFGDKKNDFIDAFKNHEDSILITEELLNRGYSEENIKKILGDNILRVIKNCLI